MARMLGGDLSDRSPLVNSRGIFGAEQRPKGSKPGVKGIRGQYKKNEHLPSLKYPIKVGNWSKEEDATLSMLVMHYWCKKRTPKWSVISKNPDLQGEAIPTFPDLPRLLCRCARRPRIPMPQTLHPAPPNPQGGWASKQCSPSPTSHNPSTLNPQGGRQVVQPKA